MKSIIIVLAALVINIEAIAQKNNLSKANKLFDQYNYALAIEQYLEVVKSDSTNLFAEQRLAECYRKNGDAFNACIHYRKFASTIIATPYDKLHFAQALMQCKQYNEAKLLWLEYKKIATSDSRIEAGLYSCNHIPQYYADSSFYSIKPSWFNEKNCSDISPTYFYTGIVFSSDRPTNGVLNGMHGWTKRNYYNLYYVSDIISGTPQLWKNKVNTRFHDATISFTNNENEFYFTRNNFNKIIPHFSADGIMKLKIYHQQKENDKWAKATEMPFNSDDYSCCHPSATIDGKQLYFASDMPGGAGGMDIYVCNFVNGKWSTPENLGAAINTEGDEVFPFIASNHVLYFSSNGKSGLGGLDIFSSYKTKSGEWSQPANMGYPFNTSKDDFGFMLKNNDLKNGMLSSNRNGDDDIFLFQIKCNLLHVKVIDEITKKPIEDAQVAINELKSATKTAVTNDAGIVNLCYNPKNSYEFEVSKNGYENNKSKIESNFDVNDLVVIPLKKSTEEYFDSSKVNITISGIVYNESDKKPMDQVQVVLKNYSTKKSDTLVTLSDGAFHFNLAYNTKFKISAVKQNCGSNWYEISTVGIKNSQDLKQGMGMYCTGDVIKLENIYYDLDKYFIRPDAVLELDKTVAVLRKYPTMRIELRSHTDSRAKFSYNIWLSQKRAEAAVNYLISKGIAQDRMLPMGYGETRLSNKCADNIPCTEEEHQANRRTEFKIISF